MIETITAVNQAVNNFIWGIPAMVCIIGVGLLLSVRTGFLQIRKFPYAIKTTIGRMFRKKDASDGAMTPFQAVCTALAGTVGTGNIAGVAGAIAIGGPGAVFWMWCSALLGMCTKFAEVTLAVHFRERSETGEWVGGPMYYIKNGLSKNWQFLAVLYSLFGVLTVFGTGNATQVNTIVCNWFGAGSPNLAKPDSDSSIQSYENIYDRNWLLKGNCMIMPGIERVDTIRTADGWTMKSIWCRDDLSDTSMLKLSTATGYIYGFMQDIDSGMWQYIVLDFATGKTVLTVDVASLYGYNNMAIGMYAGRDGNKLYCPTGYKELLRLQDRFVYLPEMPYRRVDLDKTSRKVITAEAFAAAGGQGTPATWLHTVTLDNVHPTTTAAIRVNGLTGKASDYKLFALGADGRYQQITENWSLEGASGRLSAKKVYEIRFAVQDGGAFDGAPDAREVTFSVLLAR